MPKIKLLLPPLLLATVLAGCGGGDDDALVVYSGRNENLVRPLLDRFEKETGIKTEVKYGDTSELLPTILEEGGKSPADVFFSQDAGALGELADKGLLAALPAGVTGVVPERFRDTQGRWVGVTGRARVIAYNTERVTADRLPASVLEVTDPVWRGKVGYPPTNASFVAFVTSLRETVGEDRTRAFLEGLKANGAKRYDNNILTLEAVASGEIELGLVNHYYLYNEFKERPGAPVANYYPGQAPGGEGTLVNVAGAGILATSDRMPDAQRFVQFLLEESSQAYFRDETTEYPLRVGIGAIPELPSLDSLRTIALPLNQLGRDLEGTVALIKEVGLS
ncbi:MAG: iron ABC transporter substrate-binding protein [Acidimicrobiales bacterium]